MRLLMLLLIFQVGYTAVGDAQETEDTAPIEIEIELNPLAQEVARSDSLSEKMEAIVKRNERIAKKVVVGALSGLITTLVAVRVQDKILKPTGEPDVDAWRPISFYFLGAVIGLTVGFPLGVTLVDPYDSFSKTLLAGVIPGMIGMALLGPITSLYASEKWRKPPQDRRVSFGLAPTFNGGFSAVAQLRF